MQQTNSVTCPECHTRFRVDAAQLALANGLLRCGVCTHIFNARGEPPTLTEADVEGGADTDTRPAGEEQDAPPLDTHPADSEAPESDDAPPKNKAEVLLDGLNTVDHDFEHHQHHRRTRRWPWLALNMIALLVLAGQLAYWQRDALLDSPARDSLLTACEWLGLPCLAQSNRAPSQGPAQPGDAANQVSTSKLLVRKHPERAQALIVDTILINRGEQTVAFPPLLLRFSDINGREVASRVFRPRDYLHGELNALSDLAPQQPVHIALEIADPGTEAVNYELEVLAAK